MLRSQRQNLYRTVARQIPISKYVYVCVLGRAGYESWSSVEVNPHHHRHHCDTLRQANHEQLPPLHSCLDSQIPYLHEAD